MGKKLDYNAVTVETLVSCISEAIDILSRVFNNNNDNNVLCLPSTVLIALMLVGRTKCLKQIIQIKLNGVKNPD